MVKQNYLSERFSVVPPSQLAIQAKCWHRTDEFVDFSEEDANSTIVARFEQQVRRRSEAPAVYNDKHECSYDELNTAANNIAVVLQKKCAGTSARVGLIFNPRTPTVASILGVLKAGFCYVPLSPDDPPARNASLIQKVGISVIITDTDHLHYATTFATDVSTLINIDLLDLSSAAANPQIEIHPDTLALILHTSGSTGEAKGVMHSHRTVLEQIRQHTNLWGIGSNDSVSSLYSFCFIGSLTDTYVALLNGAALHQIDLLAKTPVELRQWLTSGRITILGCVVPLFRTLLSLLEDSDVCSGVRLIFLTGEQVLGTDVEIFRQHFSDMCVLYVGYGSTESGATLRHYFLDRNTSVTSATVPLGYAATDIRLALLDGDFEVTQTGRIGEICVQAPSLSPGYWDAAEPHQPPQAPIFPRDTFRILRMGDLAYFESDGCLVSLGRADSQTKIRGHRIELEEIENELRKIRQIKDAAACTSKDHLWAFIVPKAGEFPQARQLKNEIADVLPAYMVPNYFVTLPSLPYTQSGKLDRRALSIIASEQLESRSTETIRADSDALY